MRYKHNWNGMTEVMWEEVMDGNTVRAAEMAQERAERAKVIKVENFTPRQTNDRTAHRKRVRRRRRRAMTYRLALQCLTMTLLLIMIAMLDGATLIQSAVLMMGIISCSAVMLLLDLDERKEKRR